MKRLWPTLLGLTFGVLALWIFFAWLFTLFRHERDDGFAEAAAHRLALETYALAEVSSALRSQLAVASTALERVREDPLLDDSALFLVVGDAQVVPARHTAGRADGERAATGVEGSDERHAGGRTDPRLIPSEVEGRGERGAGAPTDPRLIPSGAEGSGERRRPKGPNNPAAPRPESALARLELLEQIEDAVSRGDRVGIEKTTRALLAERARYVIPVDLDAPVVLSTIKALQRAGPAPELMRMLLRDGVSLDGKTVPQGLEGLQRGLLRRRGRVSDEQWSRLCADIARVSREQRVTTADFEARCASKPTARPPVWQLLPGDCLWKGEQVWFVHSGNGQAEGVAVDIRALVDDLSTRLRARSLLSARDTLALEVPPGASGLSALSMRLQAPEFDESARRRGERFALKSMLLGVSAALSLGLAALAILAQRRKLRFVELKSDFVATVSHELRTPLASMRVMAETLEHRLQGLPAAKDYPARIVREVDGLSLLVDNILSFNRLDKGRWQRKEGTVALRTMTEALRVEAERYPGARVVLTFAGFDEGQLDADAELLQLLLLNLLRNGCKYNANDPVRISFALEGSTLRVSDNGVGIPPEQQENVFVEFNRLPGQRGRGGAGSGLGLALARRIMGLHRGTIAVERSTAEGTTFVLKFPSGA